MKDRPQLNKLVVATIKSYTKPPIAYDIYSNIRINYPDIFHTERIYTFKSFVKIMTQLPNVEKMGESRLKVYTVKFK